MVKHSIVSPSPFVPLGEFWKGLAHAAWAAVNGEKVGPVVKVEVDKIGMVELDDKELDVMDDIDQLEGVEDVEDV